MRLGWGSGIITLFYYLYTDNYFSKQIYKQHYPFSFHFQVYFVCEKFLSNCNKTDGYFHQWKQEHQKQSLGGVLQKEWS